MDIINEHLAQFKKKKANKGVWGGWVLHPWQGCGFLSHDCGLLGPSLLSRSYGFPLQF